MHFRCINDCTTEGFCFNLNLRCDLIAYRDITAIEKSYQLELCYFVAESFETVELWWE